MLYICLCGFPPFSDELCNAENPYTLSQQIKLGRFDYPSPYWDVVGDPALDLIDKMLTIEATKRATIDECLEHPWITQQAINHTDSTDGLTGALGAMDFSKRKIARERTLLSSVNDIKICQVVQQQKDEPVKIWDKNPNGGPKVQNRKIKKHKDKTLKQEEAPAAARDPKEFIAMGGKGDQPLFGDDVNSHYP